MTYARSSFRQSVREGAGRGTIHRTARRHLSCTHRRQASDAQPVLPAIRDHRIDVRAKLVPDLRMSLFGRPPFEQVKLARASRAQLSARSRRPLSHAAENAR